MATVILKKILKIKRNKNKNHNKIVILAKSKLNSIETLIFQTLIDLEISHEEFKTMLNEEENYKRLKENIRMMKNNDELNKEGKTTKL